MQLRSLFHNVAEADPVPNLPGLLLQRFPRDVRERLNNSARQSGQDNSGVEIRFKTTAPQARVTLTAHLGDEGEAVFYKGSYEHTRFKLPHGVTTALALPYVAKLFEGQPPEVRDAGGFSSDVWRVCIQRCAVRFHGVDTYGHPQMPLERGDTPRLRWLAYGSSITHSWLDGYPFMAAKLLGVDVLNKGIAGGCHAEPEVAEFLAGQDWDFLTAELGVNMADEFSPEAFEAQVRRFMQIVRAAQPRKPVVLITPFRNGSESNTGPVNKNLAAYRTILAAIHAEANDPLLGILDGNEILPRPDFLRFDLVHPSTHGHALMGVNLARHLQPLVDGLL
jgi:lysophospholipase L1-like esterase